LLDHQHDAFHGLHIAGVAGQREGGQGLFAQGQKEQAVERYRQSVEVDPTFAEAWNNLGPALCELGQRDDAVRAYRQVLLLAPGFADVHYNLADVLEELGRAGGI
jgi:Flp pilus assembly protein TadD